MGMLGLDEKDVNKIFNKLIGTSGFDEKLKDKIVKICNSNKDINQKIVEFQSAKVKYESLEKEYAQKLQTLQNDISKVKGQELKLEKEKKELAIEKSNLSKENLEDLKGLFDSEREAIALLRKSLNDSFSEIKNAVSADMAKLIEKELDINTREIELNTGLVAKNKDLAEKLEEEKAFIKTQKVDLLKREAKYAEHMQRYNSQKDELDKLKAQSENGFALEKKKILEKAELECVNLKSACENEISQRKKDWEVEKKRLIAELEKERSDIANEKSRWLEEFKKDRQLERDNFEAEKKEFNEFLGSRKDELDKKESSLEEMKSLVLKKETSNKTLEENIRNEVKTELEHIDDLKAKNQKLIKQIATLESIKAEGDTIKQLLDGKSAKEFSEIIDSKLKDISDRDNAFEERKNKLEEENKSLKAKLEAESISIEDLRAREKSLDEKDLELCRRELECQKIQRENNELKPKIDYYQSEVNSLQDKLSRYLNDFNQKSSYDERVAVINMPVVEQKPKVYQGDDEIKWLNNIYDKCKEHGLAFSNRILYSFHTALKSAEYSPLAILAGISGTGKSELPRLYSLFGGMNFISLAVQPNWDSPESMLGYFNSIDDRFEAQPVLKFLSQAQRSDGEYPMSDVMNMVLLDEMNLAHIELYFSDFLSKLELRRGCKPSNLPNLDIKLGAKINDSFKLKLNRNVLWSGTMNQDETTKALSDKVIDRGYLLNFPRPRSLKSRETFKTLPSFPETLLSKQTWAKWVTLNLSKVYQDREVLAAKMSKLRETVEEINEKLAVVGRGLGHRVWQSIEFYINNHPYFTKLLNNKEDNKISKAITLAFEDQFVMKIAPKLRGIETTGTARSDCLDAIRFILEREALSKEILKDFDNACQSGYGQFIWQSSEYINNKENEDTLSKLSV